jgi:hypothetical protein
MGNVLGACGERYGGASPIPPMHVPRSRRERPARSRNARKKGGRSRSQLRCHVLPVVSEVPLCCLTGAFARMSPGLVYDWHGRQPVAWSSAIAQTVPRLRQAISGRSGPRLGVLGHSGR